MRVSIIGAGYVGLVSGACLADKGHLVTCVDSNPERVSQIENGKAPFYEPGLNEVLSRVCGERLLASVDFDEAVRNSDLTLIAVGTPSRQDGSADLTAIEGVARQIGAVLREKDDFHIVIVKSTVPVGTTEKVVGKLIEEVSGKRRSEGFGLGMNPEFLTEGTAVSDFQVPDRIVIGGADRRTLDAQRELYSDFDSALILEVGNSTAEMIKYMSNALLATMISFANEFADLCSAVGDVDARDVQKGVHLSRYLTLMADQDSRTAPIASFLEAGCGFGGSCLPKDVKSLVSMGDNAGMPMRMLEAVLAINSERAVRMVDLLKQHMPDLNDRKVAVLGLSFRPDTNDMRESPAIPIIQNLDSAGAKIVAYDPKAISEARQVITTSGIGYADNLEDCINGVDAILLAPLPASTKSRSRFAL